MSKRNPETQKAIREEAFQEHYRVFEGHRIFCHATLAGFYNRRWDTPQKVDAHHIAPYARLGEAGHIVSNIILIDPLYHDAIHNEYWLRGGKWDVEDITQEFVSRSFNSAWRNVNKVYLPSGVKFVDVWESLLISKALL